MKKNAEYIKCATGPDLWNYVNILRKNFYFEISKVQTGPTLWNYVKKMQEYIKGATGPGPVELFEKLLELYNVPQVMDLWNYVKNW